jgi:hypothetical protein
MDENVDRVEGLLPQNRRITIHEVSNVVGVPFGSVQSIFKDKRPERLEVGGLVFLHKNAPPHCTSSGHEFLAETKIIVHFTLSKLTRLSAMQLYFPELKVALKGRRFNDTMIQAKFWDTLVEFQIIIMVV